MSVAASVRGQTAHVGGVVIDDRTQLPIKGVQVYVQNQSAMAETDAAGRFLLLVAPGRQTIAASMIGYALLQVDIEVGDVPLDLTLRLLEGAGAHTERVTVAGSLAGEFDPVPGATSLTFATRATVSIAPAAYSKRLTRQSFSFLMSHCCLDSLTRMFI